MERDFLPWNSAPPFLARNSRFARPSVSAGGPEKVPFTCTRAATRRHLTVNSWRSGEESAHQCGRHRSLGFLPWLRKIPWGRKWLPSPVFLPGKSYGQKSLAGCNPRGCKESDTAERAHTLALESEEGKCSDGKISFDLLLGIPSWDLSVTHHHHETL